MAVKDQTYIPSAPYEPQGALNSEIAVVYYSRSGHSEAVAREVARKFNAPIARIDADYPRDFSGQRKAVSDARAQALPQIRVEPIDLALALRVFLVSPTWIFRPATPLWAYVEQADLQARRSCSLRPATAASSRRRPTRSRNASKHAAVASLTTSSCAAVASTGRRAAKNS